MTGSGEQSERHQKIYDCEGPDRPTFSIAKNEVNSHYHFTGGTDRLWIQPAALLRNDQRVHHGVLIEVQSEPEKEIAYEFGRYFHKELGFDHPPYDIKGKRPNGERVFLIRSPDISHGSFEFIVGAVGTVPLDEDTAIVTWFWLHPFARGSVHRSLALEAWTSLESIFDELCVLAPISKPMKHFLTKYRSKTTLVDRRSN